MSIQRDPDGRRSVRVEVEVPGTPEQVWHAIATGPGISAWFVPTKAETHQGGEMVCDFGNGMVSTAKITAFEPPFRFAAESPGWGPGMPPIATEWTVEARRGGTCVVRVVHSLFASTDDWDDQLTGTESGWPSFFRVLARYLRQFAGQPSASVQATAMTAEPFAKAWSVLTQAMFRGTPKPGQRLTATIAPGVTLAGDVAHVDDLGHGHNVHVALAQPIAGTLVAGAYACGGTMVQMSVYLYGGKADSGAAAVRQHLSTWLAALFPAPAA